MRFLYKAMLILGMLMSYQASGLAQDISVKEHVEVKTGIAIFHDPASAAHWANEMGGKVIKGENDTYIVLYKENYVVSTPNDWHDT